MYIFSMVLRQRDLLLSSTAIQNTCMPSSVQLLIGQAVSTVLLPSVDLALVETLLPAGLLCFILALMDM